MTFLGFVISANGIEIDSAKVDAIHTWEAPKCVKDVQCFLGFANFYRRFIHKYFEICQPLFNLLRKDTPFLWSLECETVFTQLKNTFTSALILRHFDLELETIVETDASDYVVSGILLQKHTHLETRKQILHPIAFMSEKMSPVECNYGIGDKELLAIISLLDKWYIYLYQLPKPFTIITDHHNLQTFTTKSLLFRRQTRWTQELAQYDFKIVLRLGQLNGKAATLTRRSEDLPEEEDGCSHTIQALIPLEKVALSAMSTQNDEEIIKALKENKLIQEIIKALQTGQRQHKIVPLEEYQVSKGLIFVNGLIYVSNDLALQQKILKSCYEQPATSYLGRAATFEIVLRNYWWLKMRHIIAHYIKNYDTCT